MSRQPWRIGYTPSARRDLRRLDAQIRTRVITAIEQLAADDPRVDVRKLAGGEEHRLASATGECASAATSTRTSS